MTLRARTHAARFAALFAIPVSLYSLAGCAGDDTNPALPSTDAGSSGGHDATTSSSSGGGSSSGGSSGGSSSGGSTDAGSDAAPDADCAKPPTLHAAGSAGPYCPFLDGGSHGSNCGAGDLCCLGEQQPSGLLNGSCQAGSACAAPTAYYFQCSGPSNCNTATGSTTDGGADGGAPDGGADGGATDAGAPAAMVCCGIGPVPSVEDKTCPAADLSSDLSATVCAPSCAAVNDGGAGLVICDTTTGECPAGTTCTAFRAHGSELGYCK